MLKSDFSNYTGLNGRGNYLVRELLYLVEQAEMHPATAAQLQALFTADVNRVQAALTAAQSRDESSGPNAGPRGVATVSIDVTPATSSRTVGQTQQLTVARTPLNASGAVTYASSDATKATVSATGLITAVAVGSATITATLGGKTDTCVVTVTA